MYLRHITLSLAGILLLIACGETPTAPRSISARSILMLAPEMVALQANAEDAYLRLLQEAQTEASLGVRGVPEIFVQIERSVVSPAVIDARLDLLQAPDAGVQLQLSFSSSNASHQVPVERLHFLSEEQAALRVAHNFLTRSGISPPKGGVRVELSAGPPAIVYVADDSNAESGESTEASDAPQALMRINSTFLYLAASHSRLQEIR